MKYIIGIALGGFLLLLFQNASYDSPEGIYADSGGTMILKFEKTGRLTVAVPRGASMAVNGRLWNGPSNDRVTVTSWERKWRSIYMDVPGSEKPLKAFRIEKEGLRFEGLLFKKIAEVP
ncbi:hypothetical protein V2O64_25085 (plasmid) [Verrucomicrobiaceae bacterium 227]